MRMCVPQGELEHRISKSRYKRTDRKAFIKQLARIERRQARIRRIRARHSDSVHEQVDSTPEKHHHIAKSQNDNVHIGTFLRKNVGDPAVQVQIKIICVITTLMFLTEFFTQFKTTPPSSYYIKTAEHKQHNS